MLYICFLVDHLSDNLSRKAIDEEYYLRFPSVLKKALLERKVVFGDHVFYKYEPIRAYRIIKRKSGDTTPIQLNDFKSYMEQLNDRGNSRSRYINENDISSYSCSFFNDLASLEKKFKGASHIPNSNHYKIIEGYVKDDYGPCDMNEKTKHIDLWLYDMCDPSLEFKVLS